MTSFSFNLKNNIFSIFLLVVLTLQTVSSRYDFAQLVLQWPPSFCKVRPGECQILPQVEMFTIHGLWPKNNSNYNKRGCWDKRRFNGFRYSPMNHQFPGDFVDLLNTQWPNLLGNSYEEFWRHEWEDHGRCGLPDYTQFSYFKFAAEAARQYNVLEMLAADGITPSDQINYPPDKIVAAIKKGFNGFTPRIRCQLSPMGDGHHYERELKEVVLCFGQALNNENRKHCPFVTQSQDSSVRFCFNDVSRPGSKTKVYETLSFPVFDRRVLPPSTSKQTNLSTHHNNNNNNKTNHN